MRAAQKIAVLIGLIALLALLLPRSAHADQSAAFGDVLVRYSALTTQQLFPDVARSYGIERSPRNGLGNIAIESRSANGAMIAGTVSGKVADLAGHSRPIRFRETNEGGSVDYLGEFPIDSAGTYVFTISVMPRGHAQAYTLRFNHDYVLD
jgi:hypothetical protein